MIEHVISFRLPMDAERRLDILAQVAEIISGDGDARLAETVTIVTKKL